MGRHVGGQHATDEASAARDVLFELAHLRLLALMGAGWRLSPGEPTGAPLYDDLVSRALAAAIARALPSVPARADPVELGSLLEAATVPAASPVAVAGARAATAIRVPMEAAEVASAPAPETASSSTSARPWPSWARTPWPEPGDSNTVEPGGAA